MIACPRSVTAALGVLVLVGGCRDEPSFELRWRIDASTRPGALESTDPDGALTNAIQCSSVGLSLIRIDTYPWRDPDETLDATLTTPIDSRDVPCFPAQFREPAATVKGPALGAGSYDVFVYGVRANEQREPYFTCSTPGCVDPRCNGPEFPFELDCLPVCEAIEADFVGLPNADEGNEIDAGERPISPECTPLLDRIGPWHCRDGRCPAPLSTCTCRTIDVREGSFETLEDVVLEAPSSCNDGIDDDRDGLVDGDDPGCRGGTTENPSDATSVEVLIDVTVLGFRPTDVCDVNALDLDELRLVHETVEPGASCLAALQNAERHDLTTRCDAPTFRLVDQFKIGSNHCFGIVAIDRRGNEIAHDFNHAPFPVEGDIPTLQATIDLGPDDFTAPLERWTEFLMCPDDGRTTHVRASIVDGLGQPLEVRLVDTARGDQPVDEAPLDDDVLYRCPPAPVRDPAAPGEPSVPIDPEGEDVRDIPPESSLVVRTEPIVFAVPRDHDGPEHAVSPRLMLQRYVFVPEDGGTSTLHECTSTPVPLPLMPGASLDPVATPNPVEANDERSPCFPPSDDD